MVGGHEHESYSGLFCVGAQVIVSCYYVASTGRDLPPAKTSEASYGPWNRIMPDAYHWKTSNFGGSLTVSGLPNTKKIRDTPHGGIDMLRYGVGTPAVHRTSCCLTTRSELMLNT